MGVVLACCHSSGFIYKNPSYYHTGVIKVHRSCLEIKLFILSDIGCPIKRWAIILEILKCKALDLVGAKEQLKIEKLNVSILKELCRQKGYNLVRLDLTSKIEEQGPFSVIFHKCTDLIVDANAGDKKCQEMVKRLEEYLTVHPEVPIVDSLENIRCVLNRYRCYLKVRENKQLATYGAFTPTSIVLTSSSSSVNLDTLKAAGVKFPFLSKPLVSHGSKAHKMAVIFNEKGVEDIVPPAFVQTFVNHNAKLYKTYCVGDRYVTVERASLKNFHAIEAQETIHFSSVTVSRSDSTSSLTKLDEDDPMRSADVVELERGRLDGIVSALQADIGLALMGLDLVIDNETGRYAVIDINVFPGYDGFPDVWEALLTHLERAVREPRVAARAPAATTPDGVSPTGDYDDSGFDTSDSSDDKRQLPRLPLS